MIRNDSETVSFDTLRARGDKMRARRFEVYCQTRDLLPKAKDLGANVNHQWAQLKIEHMKHSILLEEIRLQCMMGRELGAVMAISGDNSARTSCALTIQ